MLQLLVIADDLTGALDTGIQFRSAKTKIKILHTADDLAFSEDELRLSVLVVDTESRHLRSDIAYQLVYTLVANAKAAGVKYIYKKTDSALRGNIGSELEAAVNAAGENLSFVPAYPKAGRITVDGVQYIDRIPVSESVYSADPFEPVTRSRVDEIIALQSALPVAFDREPPVGKGITVYNADSTETLENIASALSCRGRLHLAAGCAGFAQVMRPYIHLEEYDPSALHLPARLLTVCGSINPITAAQLNWAEAHGTRKIILDARQRDDPAWMGTAEGQALLKKFTANANLHNTIITSEYDPSQTPKEPDLLEELRKTIAANYGLLVQKMLAEGLNAVLLLTGGDVLSAFLDRIRVKSFAPLAQLADGIVLSELFYRGKMLYIISKSGGLGERSVITDLEKKLKDQEACHAIPPCFENAPGSLQRHRFPE